MAYTAVIIATEEARCSCLLSPSGSSNLLLVFRAR
jgi:hypothetical protein